MPTLLALTLATAHAGQAMLEIDTRPGASLAALEMTAPGAVPNVVIYMVGGSGQRPLRGLDFDDLPTDPDTLFAAQRQLANQVGAVVAIDTATDHPVLEMSDRQGAAHQQDIHAVIAAMRQRHPGARMVLMGSSNGAYSAAVLGLKLAPEVDAVILVNGSADAWAAAAHLKQPVLGLQHRRDACLPFRDSYPRARFFSLIEVDDARFPPVGQSTPRDCSAQSAHAMHGRRASVYRAIGDWIISGKVSQKIE
ncbi:MAG: alpha/beta hydrolase [Pseudomonadota bacterium]